MTGRERLNLAALIPHTLMDARKPAEPHDFLKFNGTISSQQDGRSVRQVKLSSLSGNVHA
jgi:hypothetical protein